MTSAALQLPAVSVIIPVRNASGCIKVCLEALRKQTLDNLEFIFVDDASTDATCSCIQQAAARDPRIVLLKQGSQGGPGRARNKGMEAARGEYIGFVDADDSICPGFFALLYKKARDTGAWVVKGGCVKTSSAGLRRASMLNERISRGLEAGESLLTLFNYEHWTGLYQREFVERIGARNGECSQGEDNIFLMQIMCHLPSEKFAIEDAALYHYCVSDSSVSCRFDADFLEESYRSLCLRLDYMATRPDSTATQEFIAEQFEEKLYSRVLRVWPSLYLNREQVRLYLEKVLCALRSWLVSHPNARLRQYTQLAMSGGYSGAVLFDAVAEQAMKRHLPEMPEDKVAQLRRDMLLLSHEKEFRLNYWRYSLLCLICFRKKEHYIRKKKNIEQLLRFIYQIKKNFAKNYINRLLIVH